LVGAVVLRLMADGQGHFSWPDDRAFAAIRQERVLIGVIVGAALAVSGVLLQCLLRNPLASPDLLGLASGAGLGVTLAAYAAYRAGGYIAPPAANVPAALIASLAALGLVYLLSQRRGLIDPISLILIGVIVAIICSAVTVFVQQLLPDKGLSVSRWLLGALRDDAAWTELVAVGAATLCAVLVAVRLGPAMDAASLGDDEARSLGVPLGALRAFLFVASGILTAGAVVLAGPIGFVGLVCPHLIRLGAGPAHRTLVVGSALAGAALVVGADALVRSIDLGTGRLPIGVLTSILGGPLFIVMLRRQRGVM
jgi:iron complex transport system permease protein